MKDFEKSLKNIKYAIDLKDNVADYYYLEALILDASNKTKDAIFSYEKFIELTDNESLKRQIQSKIKKLYDNVVE